MASRRGQAGRAPTTKQRMVPLPRSAEEELDGVSDTEHYATTRHSWMSWSGATSSNVTSTAAPTGTL
jgi:hypothetical protein